MVEQFLAVSKKCNEFFVFKLEQLDLFNVRPLSLRGFAFICLNVLAFDNAASNVDFSRTVEHSLVNDALLNRCRAWCLPLGLGLLE
jgi:hypothetical protein